MNSRKIITFFSMCVAMLLCIAYAIPTVTLNGSNPLIVSHWSVFVDPGATRNESDDWSSWDITAATSWSIDTNILWDQYLEYTYTNTTGSDTKQRTVTITDQTPPLVTLLWSTSITINQYDTYTELWASWIDNIDGSNTILVPTSWSVDTNIVGSYILEYTYSDIAGNSWNIVTRTVNIVDTISPIVTTWSQSINEGNNITINMLGNVSDNNSIINYWFDIDNNGSTDFTSTSGILTLTWSQLQTFWITWNNATLIPTDVYTIKLTATDASNNIWNGIFQLKVYNTSPVWTITAPIISGKIYSGNLNLNRTILDPADQDFPMNTDVYYSSNGSVYAPIATTTSSRTWSLLWDTTTVPDGITYTTRVRTIDDYWNHTVTSLPFKIDNTGPIISGQIVYTINEWNTVTFSLTGTSDAISWLSWFIWDINSNFTGSTTGKLILTWGQLQSFGINNDGTYTIPVKAYDAMWNISTQNLTLHINNTAPSLTISQPTAWIYSWVRSIVRTTSDVANGDLPLWILINYSNWIHSGSIIQSTWLLSPYNRNTTTIPDWTGYIITIQSSDDDSHTIKTGQTISIDNTAPTISWFNTNYVINEWSGLIIDLRSSTDNLAWLVWGSAKFIWTINWVSLPVSTSWYRNINWSALSSYGITNWYGQSYNIIVNVSDAIWNTSNKSGTLLVNNVTPIITVTSPTLTTLTWTIPVSFTIVDPADTTMNFIVEYAPNPTLTWTILWTGSYPATTWISRNTTSIPDNSYYIRVRAIDDQHTGSIMAWPFNIDNIANNIWLWGGWSSGMPSKDFCPDGDYTSNFYDNSCGTKPITATWIIATWEIIADTLIEFSKDQIFNPAIENDLCFHRDDSITISNSKSITTNEEFKKALAFSYAYKMTSFDSIDEFQPYTKLTRQQAAKIFSNFAMNVLCRKPDTSLQPSYVDTYNANDTLKPYITKAYQLWLMKWGTVNNFRPFDTITKAEFNAVLIRMILNWFLSEDSTNRYDEYNRVSTELGIITQWAWPRHLSRYDASLMLFRAYKNQSFVLHTDQSYTLKNHTQYVK